MRQKITKFFSIAFVFCIILGSIPQFAMTVRADTTYQADISKGSVKVTKSSISYTDTNGTSHKNASYSGGTIKIKGSTKKNTIVVDGAKAKITLSAVSIDVSSTEDSCAFKLANKASVSLTLAVGTSNKLKSGDNCAGLQVPKNTSVTIDGTGSLAANGGDYGAGIGAGINSYVDDDSSGDITIREGTINATGQSGGAGIGGSCNASGWGTSCGIVTISGGTVTATGSKMNNNSVGSAGIGGGYNGAGGTVTITGGTVIAKGISGGKGIGQGTYGTYAQCYISGGTVKSNSIGGTPKVKPGDSTPVYLTSIKLGDVSANTKITGLKTNLSSYTYGTKDIYTKDGELFLWLPKNTEITQIQTSAKKYICSVKTKDSKTLTSPPVLNSIQYKNTITGVKNGTKKDADALGLPSKITLLTNNGDFGTDVNWDVAASAYDPSDLQEQTFQVDGKVTLPDGISNPDKVSLDISVKLTVSKTEKMILKKIESFDDITDVANGTAKSVSALGLPSKATLDTDGKDEKTDVHWEVQDCSYDPDDTEEQTFTVKGTATLPKDILNPDNVSLEVSINVTVRKAASTDKILKEIEEPDDITSLTHGDKDVSDLLPTIILDTDKGRVSAKVKWEGKVVSSDSDQIVYNYKGTVILPKDVVNKEDIPLEVSLDFTVLSGSEKKTIKSIASPSEAQRVANGNEKSEEGLCLPKAVKAETEDGEEVDVPVTWDVKDCDYDKKETEEQTFDVSGTVHLPNRINNENDIPLDVSITVSVIGTPKKILESIKEPDDIEDVPNGTDKKASDLGLPPAVTLVTNVGKVSAKVIWDVEGCEYDPQKTEEQTFTVTGNVNLPDGIHNSNDVSLEVSVEVTVLKASTEERNLVSIAEPAAITEVSNGCAKTASALGLPSVVKLETDKGYVNAKVTWDVNGCPYDPSLEAEQTFYVDGKVTLPSGVTNTSEVLLTTTIKVTVKKASGSGKSHEGGSSKHDSDDNHDYGWDTVKAKVKERTQPVNTRSELTPSLDNNGKETITVSDQMIQQAIDKANGQKTTKNGISVSFIIENQEETRTLNMVIKKSVMEKLTDSSVQDLSVKNGLVDFQLDKEAVKKIAKESNGDVKLSVTPASAAELSAEAKSIIGTRTICKLNLSYVKDGKKVNINKLDQGKMTISIPYKPENESAGYLYAVCVDNHGKVIKIQDSVYDENSQSLIFTTDQLAVYGVGYRKPSESYSDVSDHWAKEAIDYMAGRGIIEGTSETEFSPDAPMTGQMLVEALGKIAGVDTGNQENKEAAYTEWANSKGLMNGLGSVDYGSPVTRETLALIMNNFTQNKNLPVTREAMNFSDSRKIGRNYKEAVMAMQQAGILMGEKDNRFNPSAKATRAETSAMLYRYIKLTIAPDTSQGWTRDDSGQAQYYKDGTPLTNWQTINGKKYYFTKENGMASNQWEKIDGKWHYFYADGTQAENTTIDGYAMNENGEMKTE